VFRLNNGQAINSPLIDSWLGKHKKLLRDKKFIDPFTVQLMFDDAESETDRRLRCFVSHRAALDFSQFNDQPTDRRKASAFSIDRNRRASAVGQPR
jgi:hypothetical protein